MGCEVDFPAILNESHASGHRNTGIYVNRASPIIMLIMKLILVDLTNVPRSEQTDTIPANWASLAHVIRPQPNAWNRLVLLLALQIICIPNCSVYSLEKPCLVVANSFAENSDVNSTDTQS